MKTILQAITPLFGRALGMNRGRDGEMGRGKGERERRGIKK